MDLTLPLDHAAIERIVPHRYPFLLVDRIVEFEADKRIVGIKNVSLNDRYLSPATAGGMPAMPNTILTEAAAQVRAIMILASARHAGIRQRPVLNLRVPGSIPARFTKPSSALSPGAEYLKEHDGDVQGTRSPQSPQRRPCFLQLCALRSNRRGRAQRRQTQSPQGSQRKAFSQVSCIEGVAESCCRTRSTWGGNE